MGSPPISLVFIFFFGGGLKLPPPGSAAYEKNNIPAIMFPIIIWALYVTTTDPNKTGRSILLNSVTQFWSQYIYNGMMY